MKRNHRNNTIPFVGIRYEVLNSKAFIVLPFAARSCYPYFCAKVKVWFTDPERYSMIFSFSFSEAQKLGYARRTFFKIICDLMRIGFIDPVSKGGLRGTCKTVSTFKLSKRWEAYGTAAYRETRWQGFKV